ncbi:hypothetical protein DEAB109302_05430 [Dermacoccus abyssi]
MSHAQNFFAPSEVQWTPSSRMTLPSIFSIGLPSLHSHDDGSTAWTRSGCAFAKSSMMALSALARAGSLRSSARSWPSTSNFGWS